MRDSANRPAGGLLAALYLLLFGYIGVYLPWFPLLLEQRGFTPRTIGLALAIVSVSRILLPPLWGVVVERLRARRRILLGCALLSGATMFALAIPWSPALTMAWLLAHGFFLVPIMPLVDAITLAFLGPHGNRYGRIRLWGSIGFIVASLGFGGVVARIGLASVPWAAGLLLVLAGLAALATGERPRRDSPAPPPKLAASDPAPARIPLRALAPLLIAAALGQASHGPYYAFFSIQLVGRGLAPLPIGALWALGVAAEVVLMAVSPVLIGRWGLVSALRWALALSIVRWSLFATGPALPLLAAGQLLHAASFGMLHLASVQLVDRTCPPGRKILGQTLLSACAYGGGIGGGLFLAGMFRLSLGDTGLYIAAALACAVALAIASGVAAPEVASRPLGERR